MQTPKPAPCSPPPSPPAESSFLDLPHVPPDFVAPEDPAPSWERRMAHARLLISWRIAQGLPSDHPPRNPERFEVLTFLRTPPELNHRGTEDTEEAKERQGGGRKR